MKQITSTHNELYKSLKQLAQSAKHRRRAGQTLLEGIHLCGSLLAQGGQPALCVYTDSARQDPEVDQIVAQCEDRSVPQVLLGESNFRAISSVENGVGLLFVINMPTPQPPQTLTGAALLLDEVQDPGNMGAILRTAAAAGVGQVYMSAGSASAWSPKVLRAGMGAHFALNIYEAVDLGQIISSAEVPVLATTLDATETVYQKDLTKPAAWLFGNEGSGISKDLLDKGVKPVIIPQNPQIDSLNVAASVAVCLFEQVRQSGRFS